MEASDSASASDELKRFLLLAKTTKGAACASLIKQVLEHPAINVFGELLEMANVQELAGTSSAPSLELLKVFAYGTWSDYVGRASELPALTKPQSLKLKKLTVVALASQSKMLEYDQLMRELEVVSVRDLEDLLIDCIYSGLLQGRLDQAARRFDVVAFAGRDVSRTELAGMASTLREWHRNAAELMGTLSTELGRFKEMADESRKAQADHEAQVEAVRANLRASQDAGEGFGQHLDSDRFNSAEFDGDEKMRKSGRFKGRHMGPGGKLAARM